MGMLLVSILSNVGVIDKLWVGHKSCLHMKLSCSLPLSRQKHRVASR